MCDGDHSTFKCGPGAHSLLKSKRIESSDQKSATACIPTITSLHIFRSLAHGPSFTEPPRAAGGPDLVTNRQGAILIGVCRVPRAGLEAPLI